MRKGWALGVAGKLPPLMVFPDSVDSVEVVIVPEGRGLWKAPSNVGEMPDAIPSSLIGDTRLIAPNADVVLGGKTLRC